jgi:hypothetical protein
MTLVITELSTFGIAMVADSAVTSTEEVPSGRAISRVLTGVQKLQPVPYLNAGLSVWGLGELPTSSGRVSTDLWLFDFIQEHESIESLDDFANTLAAELQRVAGDVDEPMGIHLAGYVDVDGEDLPTFYHVRNNDGDFRRGYDIHDFVPGQDFPPQAVDQGWYRTRNGDYGAYAVLSSAVEAALAHIQQDPTLDLTVPSESLQGRVAYLAAWLRFVSDLYASSSLLRTIGGEISALGIAPTGRITHYPTA